jgi:hypothetical protein
MDPKTALLDQLKIDRTRNPSPAGGGSGRRWLIGIGAVVVLAAAVVVWIFAFARDGMPVHTVVAKAIATGSGGGSSG